MKLSKQIDDNIKRLKEMNAAEIVIKISQKNIDKLKIQMPLSIMYVGEKIFYKGCELKLKNENT